MQLLGDLPNVSEFMQILFERISIFCSFFCMYMMERKYTQITGHVKMTFGKFEMLSFVRCDVIRF